MSASAPTVLDRLVAAIREAAVYNRHDLAEPGVILWPDGEKLWSRIIPILRDAMPELLTLDPDGTSPRSGPAAKLRYLLNRGEVKEKPVIYMPGVPRHSFRGAAGFPAEARHLFALQFQGQFWTQRSGKDWTPSAFLSSGDGGLGLDLARDQSTIQALSDQLEHVLRTRVDDLRGRRLEAADIHGLAASDPIRLLLQWISDPEGSRKGWKTGEWAGFAALCRKMFALDPEKDGVITAVERLVRGQGSWDQVWERYREAPQAFGGVRKALDTVQPHDLLDAANDRIPANNRRQEDNLRNGLEALSNLPPSPALEELGKLAAAHARRADSLWADLGEAPLAKAAARLGAMAAAIGKGYPKPDWPALAAYYRDTGSLVDTAARQALNQVRSAPDLRAVTTALRSAYIPWLEKLTAVAEGIADAYPNSQPRNCRSLEPSSGTVVLFVDGLRCDLGVELAGMLQASGLTAELKTDWAALPTVTATSKPAWQPIASKLKGDRISEDFAPYCLKENRALKTGDFRKLLLEAGWLWIEPGGTGDPSQPGWTETGSLDHYGHDQGAKVAWRIAEELQIVLQHIKELLQSGWRSVVVTTDHGWLLAPGGLPKADLPTHLTLSKWGRCALTHPDAHHGFRQAPWFWDGSQAVALAPGISVFKEGMEYAHGGMSLQEALTPMLTVSAGAAPEAEAVRIESTKWIGLRLQVQLSAVPPGVALDLRTKPADAASSVLPDRERLKSPSPSGQAALLVERDDLIGQAAVLVILRAGRVIAKQPVTIAEN